MFFLETPPVGPSSPPQGSFSPPPPLISHTLILNLTFPTASNIGPAVGGAIGGIAVVALIVLIVIVIILLFVRRGKSLLYTCMWGWGGG